MSTQPIDHTYHPNRDGRPRRALRSLALAVAAFITVGNLAAWFPQPDLPKAPPGGVTYKYVRLADPARTEVRLTRDNSLVATFTDGARTVQFVGPKRVLKAPGTTVTVTSTTWVRLAPTAFQGKVDVAWVSQQRTNTKADLLAQSTEYFDNAQDVMLNGLRISGDNTYGPMDEEGNMIEGSDFNDYLGISVDYQDQKDPPEADQFGSMDCSGYMRMLFGFRNSYPLASDDPDFAAPGKLPRRAVDQEASGLGVKLYKNAGTQLKTFTKLVPGTLVFFDADPEKDGTDIDHVGMYLGVDSLGRQRFVHSRQTANRGSTFDDEGGASVLDGTGDYAKAYRSAILL